jgi:hypothetical protein
MVSPWTLVHGIIAEGGGDDVLEKYERGRRKASVKIFRTSK